MRPLIIADLTSVINKFTSFGLPILSLSQVSQQLRESGFHYSDYIFYHFHRFLSQGLNFLFSDFEFMLYHYKGSKFQIISIFPSFFLPKIFFLLLVQLCGVLFLRSTLFIGLTLFFQFLYFAEISTSRNFPSVFQYSTSFGEQCYVSSFARFWSREGQNDSQMPRRKYLLNVLLLLNVKKYISWYKYHTQRFMCWN